MYIEAINRAISGLPPERMRIHVCWGAGSGRPAVDEDVAYAKLQSLANGADLASQRLGAAVLA